MTQFSEQLPADDTNSEIRYRNAVRYVMCQQIAELRALKLHGHFPWASCALRIDVCSRLEELGGLAGEW
ncbi:hypothetical protein WS62_24270 [Burkholderia sp. ABCPW 14]|uniref:hypothetical protein n=1 Tax=Burkholderia sp. ABCPW 14 TaxID=1637860 RepID=UPI000770CCB2|nr:hypothetical protein [Burkholderia sp. ABCPW 14]KVD81701.1 hypothetical protein WS62_24270 [Burkholderia sp. ABCPW 14]